MELSCIVEGAGEDDALPVLLRRIIADIDPPLYSLRIHRPLRRPTGQLRKQELLSTAVQVSARRFTSAGAILILLDADDDCPVELGARLLSWATLARSDLPIAVVVANREYEAWFLAAAQSLRGHHGLPADLSPPDNPDAIGGAKEWIQRHTPRGIRYSPTRDQASFSQRMDLELARQNSRSFRKLDKEVRRLVEALQAAQN